MENIEKNENKTTDSGEVLIMDESDKPAIEEESPAKQDKDPVIEFLCPQPIKPAAKGVWKRHHQKSSKNDLPETSEIEKDVNLPKTDTEPESYTREVPVKGENKYYPIQEISARVDMNALLKARLDKGRKRVLSFFGDDCDSEYEGFHVIKGSKDSQRSAFAAYDKKMSDKKAMGASSTKSNNLPLDSKTFRPRKTAVSHTVTSGAAGYSKSSLSSVEDLADYFHDHNSPKDNMTFSLMKMKAELEELKQQKQRIKRDMFSEENLSSQQRFQQMFRNIDHDIQSKEVEYQGLIALQNSNDLKEKSNNNN